VVCRRHDESHSTGQTRSAADLSLSSLVTVITVAVLVAWLLASTVCQIPKLRMAHWLRRHDRFDLLPSWAFFAPIPVTRDLDLWYRACRALGEEPTWHRFGRSNQQRFFLLWNPCLRSEQTVLELCARVLNIAFDDLSLDLRQVSWFQLLADRANRDSGGNGPADVQLKIAQSSWLTNVQESEPLLIGPQCGESGGA